MAGTDFAVQLTCAKTPLIPITNMDAQNVNSSNRRKPNRCFAKNTDMQGKMIHNELRQDERCVDVVCGHVCCCMSVVEKLVVSVLSYVKTINCNLILIDLSKEKSL